MAILGGGLVICGQMCLTHGNSNQNNTGFGQYALRSSNASQVCNTAFGQFALQSNSLSYRYNTAFGNGALCSNTNGQQNTAVGGFSGRQLTSPYQNTAFGTRSLCAHTTGCKQIAIGACAMYNSTTASKSIGVGFRARTANAACSVAIGAYAQATGARSVGIGAGVIASGDDSTAIGNSATSTGDSSTSIGKSSNADGIQSISIGAGSTSQNDYNITIAFNVNNTYASGTIVMGNTSNSVCNRIYTGWTYCSDANEKTNVETLAYNFGLPLIRKLRPVKFNWDIREKYVEECGFEWGQKDGTLSQEKEQYGLIAQELEQSLNELNLRFDSLKNNGKRYRLISTDLLAPLVKSIQQLSTKLDAIKQRIIILETI